MPSPGPERRLAAIMFTDIVASTALMAESEQKGLGVRERHRTLVAPLVERYGGEWIEAKGDDRGRATSGSLLATPSGDWGAARRGPQLIAVSVGRHDR